MIVEGEPTLETIDTAMGFDETRIFRAGPSTLVVSSSQGYSVGNFDTKAISPQERTRYSVTTGLRQRSSSFPPDYPEKPLESGSILRGLYEVLKPIGRGGFGYVYLCQNSKNGTLIAIKEAYPPGAGRKGTTVIGKDDEETSVVRQAILREASLVGSISEPGMLRFEEVFEENETLYFAMSYIEGESLSSLINRRGVLSPKTFELLAASLLNAVSVLHNNDIIHGDIKPSNLIVRPDKSLVLVDLGSSFRWSLGKLNPSFTSTYTPAYSPIEQFMVKPELNPSSDVYSVSATLGTMLTGGAPPSASSLTTEPGLLSSYLDGIAEVSSRVTQWKHAIEAGMQNFVNERTPDISTLRSNMGFDTQSQSLGLEFRVADGRSVFISYAHKDKLIVEKHVRAIQQRGAGVWIDREDGIKGGSDAWAGDIYRGMKEAKLVVVFCSQNSMLSECVRKEIYLANELKKRIVVVRLDNTPFHEDVLLFLSPTQQLRKTDLDMLEISKSVVGILDSMEANLS